MTNSVALREAIKAAGIKLETICAACNMTYATLRGRIANESEFTAPEITKISKLLNLTHEQREHIFFCDEG